MADTKIQKQGRIYISESEYNALRLTGKLQPNTEYCITKVINKGGTIEGSVVITGDLTVQGKTTTKDIENVSTKNYLITLAEDNTTALTVPAGIKVPKYNGTESGALVFDANGVAYVGDVVLKDDGNIDVAASDLQPLATRGALVDGNLVSWNSASLTLVDSGKKVGDFIEKWTPTDARLYVYAVDQNGTQTHQVYSNNPIPWSIVRRGSTNQSEFGTPTEDAHAATKKYVDDGFVTKNTTTPKTIYAVDSAQKPINLPFTQNATANTMAQRYTNGRLRVGEPVENSDATTVTYVKAQRTYDHHIIIYQKYQDSDAAAAGENVNMEIFLTARSNSDTVEIVDIISLNLLLSGYDTMSSMYLASGYIEEPDHSQFWVVYGLFVEAGGGDIIVQVYNRESGERASLTLSSYSLSFDVATINPYFE